MGAVVSCPRSCDHDRDFKSARTWRICGLQGFVVVGAGQAAWGPQLGGTAAQGRQCPRPPSGPRCLVAANRVGCRWRPALDRAASGPPALPAGLPSRCPPCPVGIPGARPSPVCWSLPQRAAFKSLLVRMEITRGLSVFNLALASIFGRACMCVCIRKIFPSVPWHRKPESSCCKQCQNQQGLPWFLASGAVLREAVGCETHRQKRAMLSAPEMRRGELEVLAPGEPRRVG